MPEVEELGNYDGLLNICRFSAGGLRKLLFFGSIFHISKSVNHFLNGNQTGIIYWSTGFGKGGEF